MKRYLAWAAAGVCLTGCDPIVPPLANTQQEPARPAVSDSMALLRAGSPSICAASDVKQTVQELILPKLSAFNDVELPMQNKQAALAALRITFDYARLGAFDPAVAKASCEATVTVEVQGREGSTAEDLTYVVSPAAEGNGTFIVSAAVSSLSAWARTAAMDILQAEAQQRLADAEQTRALREQEELARVVSSRWLVGRWIPMGADAGDCVDGPYDEYRRGGDYTGHTAGGRWTLSGLDLNVRVLNNGQTDSIDTTITAAAADSFTEEGGGRTFDRRRCKRLDMIPVTSPDADLAI